MDRWLNKEVELSRRHEELIMRREALLRGTEAYFDIQNARGSSFISNINKAEQRNQMLLKDIRECLSELKDDITSQGTPKFTTLKNNYWAMVRNVLPVWYEELQEYEKRHGIKPFSAAPTPRVEASELPSYQKNLNLTPSENKTPRLDVESADEATLVSVPPLDLDASQVEDATQSLSTVTAGRGSAKRVHYDEQSLRKAARSRSSALDDKNIYVSDVKSKTESQLSQGAKKSSKVKKAKKDSKKKAKNK